MPTPDLDESSVGTSTRDRLLAAAERCLRRQGIRRTTVVEVAEEAGLSRAALYKHFPDKASLVVAAIARTDERFWDEARRRVAAEPDLVSQVAAAVAFSWGQEPATLALQLEADEPDSFHATVGTGLRAMLPGLAEFWHPFLEAARASGEVREDLDVARAAEWVMRIVLSLVTVPGEAVDPRDEEQVRRFLGDHLVAGLR